MNYDLRTYLKRYQIYDNATCAKIIEEIDRDCDWIKMPNDIQGTYGDIEVKNINGLPGSKLAIDWQDLMSNPSITNDVEDYNYMFVEQHQTDIVSSVPEIMDKYFADTNLSWYQKYHGHTDPKFIRYRQTSDMELHCDHVRYIFDGKRKGIPTTTILGCLNDDYEGGSVEFWEDEQIRIASGEVLVWPSNFLYPHQVLEVTRGMRYTFVIWVW